MARFGRFPGENSWNASKIPTFRQKACLGTTPKPRRTTKSLADSDSTQFEMQISNAFMQICEFSFFDRIWAEQLPGRECFAPCRNPNHNTQQAAREGRSSGSLEAPNPFEIGSGYKFFVILKIPKTTKIAEHTVLVTTGAWGPGCKWCNFRMIQIRRFRISNRPGAVRSFSWRESMKCIKNLNFSSKVVPWNNPQTSTDDKIVGRFGFYAA